MRVLTAEKIRNVEKLAFESNFTEYQLMEKAGLKCAAEIIDYYSLNDNPLSVAVLCGNGKNGGDGFVIARRIAKAGCETVIVLAEHEPQLSEPKQMYDLAKSDGVPVVYFSEVGTELVPCADIVVDCLFGIGFHGEPSAIYSNIFDVINSSGAQVVAVDVPSGVNSTTGEACQNAVKADLTIAISTYKYSHVLPPANGFCGQLRVVDIGIPQHCYGDGPYAKIIDKTDAKEAFTAREKNSHKGSFGTLLSVCGSLSMPGAAVIAAKAAIKSGVGLVKCACPKSAQPIIASHLVESVFLPLSENEEKTLSMGALTRLLEAVEKASAILIGCGMGENDDTQVLLSQVLLKAKCPVIIDADGINVLSRNIHILRETKADVILTPHPGEMARLVNNTTAFVQKNRLDLAKSFATEYGVTLALKGANTIVTDGKSVYFNTSGNPGMAKAGSGDMLAGLAASLVAQGNDPICALKSAVYIHGVAGDICASELSQSGMSVSDMLEVLPALLSEYEK